MAQHARRGGRINLEFALAWVGLVAIVAVAFFVQGQQLDRLEEDVHTATIANQVVSARLQRFDEVCQLFIAVEPKQRDAIVEAFANGGVDCFPGTEGGTP